MKDIAKAFTQTVITISLICALVAAAIEACAAWSVASIFLGANLAFFLCTAVFHFSIADSICVFETTFKVLANSMELSSKISSWSIIAWIMIYAGVIYGSFCLLLPFTYMNSSFQMSIFAYVYFPKYHDVIPYVISWLIMPAALTTTLNAFNKAWACVTELALFVERHSWQSSSQKDAYEIIYASASWALALMLTLTFSESVYLSLHYGVAHYTVMHNAKFALTHIQETMLLSLISLSTFRTMFAVASSGCFMLMKPAQTIKQSQEAASKMTLRTVVIHVWGYLTILIRAAVRGIQTASIGQGFKQVAVNVIDKGRSNSVATLLLRPKAYRYDDAKKNQKYQEKHHANKNSGYEQLISSLSHIRLC